MMRLSGVIVVFLVVAANLLGWTVVNRPKTAEPWLEQIKGVAYDRKNPTDAEIEQDLAVIAGSADAIRIYNSTDGMQDVPRIAAQDGLSVIAGAWIDGDLAKNDREIAGVIKEARENPNVKRVLIGNEALLRGDVTAEQLTSYIRYVRTQVKVPVSTAEPWHVWTVTNPDLGKEVDFIAIHILPYWEGISEEQALDHTLARYQEVKNRFRDKPVVITEVGWPSEGRTRRDAQPSIANEGVFLRDFLNVANRRGLDYYVMEAFDQPWKRNIEGSVGGYWGVWDADRHMKFPLFGPVMNVAEWPKLAAAASLLALLPMLLFVWRWRDLKPGGQAFFAGLIQISSSMLIWILYCGSQTYFTAGTLLMWSFLLPLFGLLMIMLLAESIEVAEVVWSGRFKRRFLPFPDDAARPMPKVSLHLPICNEPPEMVKQTLDALARLDYADFEVLVIDNNTKDAAVWLPVQAHCEALGPRFRFFHVDAMKGFKAGALNFALRHTAADAEVIGVVDSDYVVTPDWLRSLMPYFDRPEVGFVQAPQDHRDWRGNLFKEMINWEYAGFFNIGMVQRNEADAIIQHGTMTLIRRSALERVGDWAEWCICEDAELGLRLLEGGYQSVYVNERFGYGLTPDSFSGYKSQRFRWVYGAAQIMKRHWREMLPGKNRKLTAAQRYHFVAGWAPWFADAVGVLFSLASVVWTIGVLALPRYFEFPLTLFLVPTIGVFGVKVLQFLWLYKARVDCSLRQRIGAGIAGLALTFTVGKAMLVGLTTSKLPFMRTPKCENQPAVVQAIAMALEECLLAVLLWLAAISIWTVYGQDDPEARLWVVVMLAQSLPYLAAVATAGINAAGNLKVAKQQPIPVATLQTAPGGE
jgi:exo-beta-1,3-glucanase (GH17 family)/cellulose synthase/poly-beta-1,6-N-acetylglucosamine synthase-like glycosyltransferase